MEAHFDELAAVNTQNHGKTLEESRGDITRPIENIDAAIAVVYTLAKGFSLEQVAEGIYTLVSKEPLGVFSVISSFNFPILILFWFIPFAIILGNTVVVKRKRECRRNASVAEYPNGCYFGATILDNATPEMLVARKERFGPVASVISLESLDYAIEMINSSTNFGNMACIYTSSGRAAREFKTGVNAGNLGINLGVAAPVGYFPFGGRRDSFYGVLHPQTDSSEFFIDKKVTIARW